MFEEAANRRRADKTLIKRTRSNGKTTIHKRSHRKLKI